MKPSTTEIEFPQLLPTGNELSPQNQPFLPQGHQSLPLEAISPNTEPFKTELHFINDYNLDSNGDTQSLNSKQHSRPTKDTTSPSSEKTKKSKLDSRLSNKNGEKEGQQLFSNSSIKCCVKLFIGGVPPKMKNGELIDLYLSQIKKIQDFPKDSEIVYCACHSGFAFIVVSNVKEAKMKKFIKDIRMEYEGRVFDVRLAIDRKTSQMKMMTQRNCKLLVNGLTNKINHQDLEKYFEKFGDLDKAYVAYCPKTGKCKGFGFVLFQKEKSAKTVLDMKYHIIKGVNVSVKRNIIKGDKAEQVDAMIQESVPDQQPQYYPQQMPVDYGHYYYGQHQYGSYYDQYQGGYYERPCEPYYQGGYQDQGYYQVEDYNGYNNYYAPQANEQFHYGCARDTGYWGEGSKYHGYQSYDQGQYYTMDNRYGYDYANNGYYN